MVMTMYIYIFGTVTARWSTCHNFGEIFARMEQVRHGDGAVCIHMWSTDPARLSTFLNFWEILAMIEQTLHGDGIVHIHIYY